MLNGLKCLGFILLLLSCGDVGEERLKFNKEYRAKITSVFQISPGAKSMLATKRYIITSHTNQEYFLKIYDKESLQEIGQMVKKGSGPDEFPTGIVVDSYEDCGQDECIWAHDLNKGQLNQFNVTKSLEEETTFVIQKVATRPESRFHTVFFVDSALVVGRSTNSTPQMNRLQLYDPYSDYIVKTVGLFPSINRTRNDLDFVTNKYNTLFVSCLGIKRDKTLIVSAMCHFDRIDIFTIGGDLVHSVNNNAEIPREISKYLMSDGPKGLRHYNVGISTSDRYIYCLYYNQPFTEYLLIQKPIEIRIFDWNGNPIAKIKVEEYLQFFTIDESNGLMYGSEFHSNKVIVYDIKNILNEI